MKQAEALQVKGIAVGIKTINGKDYISLTDIARSKNPGEPKDVVKNWMRSRETIEFPGLWEKLNNPDFKGVDFDPFLPAERSRTRTSRSSSLRG